MNWPGTHQMTREVKIIDLLTNYCQIGTWSTCYIPHRLVNLFCHFGVRYEHIRSRSQISDTSWRCMQLFTFHHSKFSLSPKSHLAVNDRAMWRLVPAVSVTESRNGWSEPRDQCGPNRAIYFSVRSLPKLGNNNAIENASWRISNPDQSLDDVTYARILASSAHKI